MERILVTGGCGFIGSSVIRHLLPRGYSICAIDNFHDNYDTRLKGFNLTHIKKTKNANLFCFYEADIRNEQALYDICKSFSPDAVIHLAAIPGVSESMRIPDLYRDVNINGTNTLLRVMNRVGISRLVFSSSSSVYGNLPAPFSEAMQLPAGLSPYAETKRRGELLIQEAFHGNAVILRLFSVYGPFMRPDLAMSIFARKMMNNEPITVYGDGSAARDYTYILDACQGIRKALDYTRMKSDIFNISGGRPVNLRTVIRTLEEEMHIKANIVFRDARFFESVCTHADLSKSKIELQYNPEINFATGIKKTIPFLLR